MGGRRSAGSKENEANRGRLKRDAEVHGEGEDMPGSIGDGGRERGRDEKREGGERNGGVRVAGSLGLFVELEEERRKQETERGKDGRRRRNGLGDSESAKHRKARVGS